jgi:hypothetical protein
MTNDLAELLTKRLNMDGVARFGRFGQCVYGDCGEVLHLFRPEVKRPVGGRQGDRVLLGDMGFVLKADCADPAERSCITPDPASLCLCPLMNFPEIVSVSVLSGNETNAEFVNGLRRYFRAMPSTLRGIQSNLGPDFLALSRIEQVPILARFLRRATQT